VRNVIALVATALIGPALAAGTSAIATASPAGFSDVICPQATQYVLAVGKLNNDAPPQRIYDVVQPAVDAYARCSKDKLADGFREPQHYADVRAAGLAVVAARALIALNRPDDARRELLQWRPLVQQVVDWQSETQTTVQPHNRKEGERLPDPVTNTVGSDHRASVYRVAAKDIVTAIDTEIAHLDGASHEQPRPQGRTAPAPTPSPKP
jgi:hypothetical protein